MDDSPPSYEEAVRVPLSSLPIRELLRIPDVIRPHPGQPQSTQRGCLIVYQFPQDHGYQSFLKIDDWVHPLISGATTFSLDERGSLCLATPIDAAGTCVTLWIDGIPPQYAYHLGSILLDVGLLHMPMATANPLQPASPRTVNSESSFRQKLGDSMKNGVASCAKFVFWSAFIAVTSLVGAHSSISPGSASAVAVFAPAGTVSVGGIVKSGVAKSFRALQVVGSTAVQVGSMVASTVGLATKTAAEAVAPHVERGGVKLVALTTMCDEFEAEAKVDVVKDYAAAGGQTVKRVYLSISDAVSMLASRVMQSSSDFYAATFGSDAENGALAVGWDARPAYNVGFLTTIETEQSAGSSARPALSSSSGNVFGRVEYPAAATYSELREAAHLVPSAPPIEDYVEDIEEFELLQVDEKFLESIRSAGER